MVKEIKKEGYLVCVCGECGYKYKDEKTAKLCEGYCKKYKKCSIHIIKKALNYKEGK